jgi:hypothetical protein
MKRAGWLCFIGSQLLGTWCLSVFQPMLLKHLGWLLLLPASGFLLLLPDAFAKHITDRLFFEVLATTAFYSINAAFLVLAARIAKKRLDTARVTVP